MNYDWVYAILIAVGAIIVGIIVACYATKNCTKKWKFARIFKSCYGYVSEDSRCCGRNVMSTDEEE